MQKGSRKSKSSTRKTNSIPTSGSLSTMDPDDLLRPIEVAAIRGASVSTLAKERMIEGRGPKFVKLGHMIYYRVEAVRDWIRSKEVSSTKSSR